uniref:Uncharacterized protein n=1 Tax=Macaca fascicularis TaxID=9541 RepID=A0A7N9C9P5_MACFA
KYFSQVKIALLQTTKSHASLSSQCIFNSQEIQNLKSFKSTTFLIWFLKSI